MTCHRTELETALVIADKALERPFADPDDNLAILARQLLRAQAGLVECSEKLKAIERDREDWENLAQQRQKKIDLLTKWLEQRQSEKSAAERIAHESHREGVMPNPLKPSTSVICKLGSALVYAEELLSPKDEAAFQSALQSVLTDPEIRQWMADMDAAILLPVRRAKP